MKPPSCEWIAFILAVLYLFHQLLPTACLWPILGVALLWGCTTLVRGSKDYSSAEYWCSRYRGTDQLYEWYLDYSKQPQISNLLRNAFCVHPCSTIRIPLGHVRVLELGAGTSTLGVAMADDMPNLKIDAIDFCGTVITRMQSKYPQVKWHEMDACSMSWPSESFDGCVDKGTMDGMLKNVETAKVAMAEVARVLKCESYWISIGITTQLDFEQDLGTKFTEFFSLERVEKVVVWQPKEPHYINVYIKVCRRK